MAESERPRRRFAPVPIETTFESVRKSTNNSQKHSQPQPHQIGPNPELTPEPSPRSPSPVAPQWRERRRFKPQLIETSRRARRVGDVQPATRPADKTDITPYTKNIYTAKPKHRRKHDDAPDDEPPRRMPPTRRETEEEAVKEYLLELAAKEAERQIQEAALAVFPNSRAREGGAVHFFFRESSGSDESPESTSPVATQNNNLSKHRRKSSSLGLGWWHQHMQEHVAKLAKIEKPDEVAVEEDTLMRSDSDLDMMDFSAPPDPLWTTSKKASVDYDYDYDRSDSMSEALAGMRRDQYTTSQPKGPPTGPSDPFDDDDMTDMSAPGTRQPETYPTSRAPAQGPFGRPFGGFGPKGDDAKAQQLRQMASPPMLGGDLVFRTCPSPKLTKLEPEHPFVEPMTEVKHRDMTGQGGLWRGYCFRTESDENFVVPPPLEASAMLATPAMPSTPGEPENGAISEEPASVFASGPDGANVGKAEHRVKNGQAKGLHMLHGLDERLRTEKAHAERNERIAQEFDDHFVTQVYNYLSLGYPSMARGFDEELSKISLVSVEDLEANDARQLAKGHMLEMNLEETPEEDRDPRWKALRIYITEWARQRGDLDNLDRLAWGVRERRGSWAI